MIAICTIRKEPCYRRSAFEAGLEKAGYKLQGGGGPKSRDDVLCLWNRQGNDQDRANDWERDGGTVIVAENGYLSTVKWQSYAIAVHGHCGSGWFYVGGPERLAALNIELKPWVKPGGYTLICGQRGIGSRLMASPAGWHDKVAKSLRANGERVVVRQHPGRCAPIKTLEQELAGASRCVIWSSAVGVTALTMGIPVEHRAPHWICEGAKGISAALPAAENDALRLAALQTMAWGQWSVDEISSGLPFVTLREHMDDCKWR